MANVEVRFTDRSNVKRKLRKLEFDKKEKFELTLNAFDILINYHHADLDSLK